MTVQTNTNVASFNGNGVTQIFPIAFKFNNATDLVVLRIDDATGTATQLALNSDYTVSGEGDEEGGLINVVVAPAVGQRLKVSRIVDILQLRDLRNQGKFFAEVHEDAFDLLTMIAQQHESGLGLALRVADTDPEPARIPAVSQRAGKLLAFDDIGNPIAAVPVTDSSAQLRIDLASSSGASLVGFSASETVAQALTRVSAVFLTSAQYDLVSLENGRTNSALNAAAWEAMRADAESLKATVIVEAGTYILPPQVKMDADNTVWIFRPGAVLKLHDTQATAQDFLLYLAPVNQQVYGLKFDANRAAQDSATFGIDKCGCIVVDPTNCKFFQTEIVSSPAKGFAVVGSGGGTVDRIVVDFITGGNCVYQAILFDGNNMTSTWKPGNFLDHVFIGETSHAGVAINDGVHNLVTGLIVCDVNNTTWDAVSLRDCWDIQMTTTRGMRGRNGVQVWSLNTTARRIDLGDAWGELNAQSGVAILAGKDIRGGTVGGRNNGVIGLNIGQRSVSGVLTTSKDISIANPVGFDDRATPVQQYGIFVGGADNVSFSSRGIAYGNTTKNVSIVRAAPTTNVQYPKVERVLNQAFTVGSGAAVDVVCTFASPFEDAEYDVDIETFVSSALSIWSANIRSKSATSVTVRVVSLTGSSGSGTVSVKATRRP